MSAPVQHSCVRSTYKYICMLVCSPRVYTCIYTRSTYKYICMYSPCIYMSVYTRGEHTNTCIYMYIHEEYIQIQRELHIQIHMYVGMLTYIYMYVGERDTPQVVELFCRSLLQVCFVVVFCRFPLQVSYFGLFEYV